MSAIVNNTWIHSSLWLAFAALSVAGFVLTDNGWTSRVVLAACTLISITLFIRDLAA